MSRRPIAVIAGAGPAGLTAAFELLARTDVHPLVFERTHAIGGIAQTYNYKGNRIDIGGHRFFSKDQRVMAWWFSMMPRQGRRRPTPGRASHDIDYVTEAVVRRFAPELMPRTTTSSAAARRCRPWRREWRCARSVASRPDPETRRRGAAAPAAPLRASTTSGTSSRIRSGSRSPSRGGSAAQHGADRDELHQGAAVAEEGRDLSSTPSSSTGSGSGSTRPSSATTRRRCGACAATRSAPTGARSA